MTKRSMDSLERAAEKQAHVVCLPFPVQSHIKAMLKMAKLLHSKGIFITFVNTEYNHNRFLKLGGAHSLDGLPGFKFESIQDGIPSSDSDATQDIPALCRSVLTKLNDESHQVTSILADGFMPFVADVAHSHGIPSILLLADFWDFISSKVPLKEDLYHLKILVVFIGLRAGVHRRMFSIIESISAGVPLLCWPFFGDQTTNCKYMCDEWECGMEIRNDVKRDDVEKLVRLLMEDGSVEGDKMRNKAMEWKKIAENACSPDGSSSLHLDKLVLQLNY